jgi:galactokinase
LKIHVISPGRVNLIGEHTDYNGGYVLPCALDLSIDLFFEKKSKKSYVATDLGYSMTFDINIPYKKSNNHWENYVFGAINELKQIKSELINFSCVIKSTLPSGAGISSSSALVCGLIKGLSKLNEINLENSDIINLSRNVEHKYIGLLGGIMDQFTILNAEKNMAILLNCENLESKFIKLEFKEYKLLLLDTNVKHNLANTEYNQRVSECKESLQIINGLCKKNYSNLSQVNKIDLSSSKENLGETLYKRASYVLNENQRVINSVEFLENDKLKEFGQLMYESHFGLKNDYEVSCKELDFLVEYTMKYNEILGSRMMGGGFGGCTISLIKDSFIIEFIEVIKKEYFSKFKRKLNPIIANLDQGLQMSLI